MRMGKMEEEGGKKQNKLPKNNRIIECVSINHGLVSYLVPPSPEPQIHSHSWLFFEDKKKNAHWIHTKSSHVDLVLSSFL